MLRGLYTAVSGLVTLEKQQSNISNNISNATTTGFKNDILITKSFDEVMLQNRDKVVGNKNVTQKLAGQIGSSTSTTRNSSSHSLYNCFVMLFTHFGIAFSRIQRIERFIFNFLHHMRCLGQ